MSYNYTNPYAPQQSQSSRKPFTPAASTQPCQILFGGLPHDATEYDIRELLISPPLALSEHGLSVKSLYSSEGKSLGMALLTVPNGVDAEKVRNHCSGQIIDATYRLAVQHILPPTQPLPPQTVEPFLPAAQRAISAPAQPKAQAPPATTPKGPKAAKVPVNAAAGRSNQPPGLQLLQRMNKAGPPGAREKQAQLLAQQKANLKLSATHPGKALLSRLNKPNSSPALLTHSKSSGKGKGTPTSDKVARAKVQANSNKMEVDQPLKKGKEKPVVKSQADLDEEMRAYDRQRRFAA